MVPRCVPYPDSLWPSNKDISLQVYFDSVGYSFPFCSTLFAKDAAIAQRAAGCDIINPNVELLFVIVVYVQTLAIRRKCKPIWLREILGQERHCAFFIQAVHALIRNFLLLTFRQIEGRIGEVQRAIWTEHYVVGTIKFLSFKMVGQDLVLANGRNLNDCPQHASAINQPALLVVSIAVCVAQADDFFFSAVSYINPENIVQSPVANVQESRVVPYRAFSKSKPSRNFAQTCILVNQLPESWRPRLKP